MPTTPNTDAARVAGQIVFPSINAALGGAQSVRWNSRFAYITKASGETVRVNRSTLPPVDKWSAFNLADSL